MKTMQAKPRQELEDLYQGIPDESVNLTFQDLANVINSSHDTKSTMATTQHVSQVSIPTEKLPHRGGESRAWGRFSHASDGAPSAQFSRAGDYSMSYEAMKSGESLAYGKGGSGQRRRPGIPHSNICTVCSNYAYLFKTRCLVCGRVYCRQCMEIGMGEMIEGRKCIECLGLRFSQRYIERAGMLGCCNWRYPSTLKQAELKWAEKGTRRSGDRGHGHHSMASSRPRNPVSIASTEPSFVMSATYSPFSAHHHVPL